MKKTMKKCLILALVIMSMIALAFCVSANNGTYYCSRCETYVSNIKVGKTYVAKCETPGYTELLCNREVKNENGETSRCDTIVGRTNLTDPLVHLETENYVEIKVFENKDTAGETKNYVIENSADRVVVQETLTTTDANDDILNIKETTTEIRVSDDLIIVVETVIVKNADKAVISETVKETVYENAVLNIESKDEKTEIVTVKSTYPDKSFTVEVVGTLIDNYYECITTCSRVVNYTPCSYKTVVENEDHTPVKYYKVTYLNKFVTDKLVEDVNYVNLADTTSYKTEEVYSEYIKENKQGQTVPAPYRMPDKKYGKYQFMGWAIGDTIVQDAATLPLEGTIAADYEASAVFEGVNVEHKITFYSERGDRLAVMCVPHGEKITKVKEVPGVTTTVNFPAAPLKADNIEYKFIFEYWALVDGKNFLSGEIYEETPDESKLPIVYRDVSLMPHYGEDLKKYTLAYFNKDGVALDKYDVVTVFGLGDNRKFATTGIDMKMNPDSHGVVGSYFDESYEYSFTGNWKIKNRDNYVIDIEKITLPNNINDYGQTGGYIEVIPEYKKVARVYELNVYVTFKDDGEYHPKTIDLQVTDESGNPIGVATLTDKDIVEGTENSRTPTYKKVFKVRYSPTYRVVATTSNNAYKGERTPGFIIDGTGYADYRPGGCTILMTRVEGDPCACICHGLLKPIWVGVLNILYNLFKVQYVCCDDMFANIGDSLAYGPK